MVEPVRFTDAEILAHRPPREVVHPRVPYGFLTEEEFSAEGRVDRVSTLFLTNRECPYRCLMCDLWRYTLTHTVAPGDLPAQIAYALERLPPAPTVKLYNAGSFFDSSAVPPEDHAAIASLLRGFGRVIVENHPRLTDERVLPFRDALNGRLEVAIGLETICEPVLQALNKRASLQDIERAIAFLRAHDIDVRVFILLRPPFMTDEEGIEWALRSIQWAFERGVWCCSVVPVRAGNGIMDALERKGLFTPPSLQAMEYVLTEGIRLGRGRVFMDLWDAEQKAATTDMDAKLLQRIKKMNRTQVYL